MFGALDAILDSDASLALAKISAQLEATKKREPTTKTEKRRLKKFDFILSLMPNESLRFIQCNVNGMKFQVDLSFNLHYRIDYHTEDGSCLQISHDSANLHTLLLRIWSLDHSLSFRSDWDANQLEPQIKSGGRRVVARMHFDRANPTQTGPKFHLQLGGNAGVDELSWFPKALDVPRFPHPPLDIVLACEMIAANFFEDEFFSTIAKDPSWIAAVKLSQKICYFNYFSLCQQVSEQNKTSLLGQLWNRS
jgi:hypothetical protein